MPSGERPRRAIALAACAIVLALSPGVAGADGLDPATRAEVEPEVLIPVAFTFDLVEAERVQIRALIASVAHRYAVDAELMLRIAECESKLDPRAAGRNGAAGLFQVIPSTWSWVTERLGLDGASPYDPAANTEVAGWLLASLGPRQWGCP